MAKRKKPDYQWFVEPKGDFAYANRVINDYLHDSEARTMENILDENNNPHNVWQCTYKQASDLRKSEKTLQAHFVIWNRPQPHGPIRYASFLIPFKKRKKAADEEKPPKKFLAPHPRPITEDTLTLPLPF